MRENLQEIPIFNGKETWLPVDFSQTNPMQIASANLYYATLENNDFQEVNHLQLFAFFPQLMLYRFPEGMIFLSQDTTGILTPCLT